MNGFGDNFSRDMRRDSDSRVPSVQVTQNGICYDLKNSPYTFTRLGLVYRFSSPLHRKKFCDKLTEREEWACDSLSRRFKCMIDARIFAAMQLYSKVETRGFSVFDSVREVEYSSWQEVHFHGVLSD